MNTTLTVYQILLFITFEIYFLIGVFGFTLNRDARINRLFLSICMALGFWAISSALAGSAAEKNQAIIWLRLTTLGWGTLYALLLHYALVFTEVKFGKQQRWIYYIIYLPAVGTWLLYGLGGKIADITVFTRIGNNWHFTYRSGGWLNAFNIYYLSYLFLMILLFIRWVISRRRNEKHHIIGFLGTMFITLLLSLSYLRYTSIHISNKVPSIIPFAALLPVLYILHSIRKYGLMRPPERNRLAGTKEFLSDYDQNRFYHILGSIFVLGSLLNLGHAIIIPTYLNQVIQFSTGFFLTGFVFILLPVLRIRKRTKDTIVLVSIVYSIVAISFRFSADHTSTAVWPLPIMFFIITTIFRRRLLLYSSIVAALIIQILFYFGLPYPASRISGLVLYTRLVVMGCSAVFALVVSWFYKRRLEDNAFQSILQEGITKVSSDLVSVSAENIDELLSAMVKTIGSYFQAEEVHFSRKTGDENSDTRYYTWSEKISDESRQSLIPKEGGTDGVLLSYSLKKDNCDFGTLTVKRKPLPERYHGPVGGHLKIAVNLLSDALLKLENAIEISRLAFHDALTELPNRRLFEDRLLNAISLADRNEKKVAVILLDLDGFKTINDTMGHDTGDILLKKVAGRLSGMIRQYDTVARFGGDEFLFILSQLDDRFPVVSITEKLMEALKVPFMIAEQELYITASIGIALYPDHGRKTGTLIKNADIAMYDSKAQGKNKYTYFTPEMTNDTHERLKLSNDLFRALEKNEFVLHYQPQVDISGQEIIGTEALIRWQHPSKGLIPPDVFIPLAEDSGQIISIGEWVLKTACLHNKTLQESGGKPIKVAVNLSGKQLYTDDLAERVGAILAETGLKPEYLELEITESVAMEHSDSISTILGRLKSLGVSISIDDFGTKYSSLEQLKNMPIDRIKIDKQFIQGISKNRKDESITSFIGSLSRSLGLKVIAEGVETKLQHTFLRENICDEIQGFYFFKPLTIEKLEEVLLKK